MYFSKKVGYVNLHSPNFYGLHEQFNSDANSTSDESNDVWKE